MSFTTKPFPRTSRRSLLLGLGGSVLASPVLAKHHRHGPRHHASAERGFDPILADIHHRTFRYFWDTSDANTGLAPDNWPKPDFCSIAAVGFALTAYCIGAENGYVSRTDAATRTLNTLRTFWNGPQEDTIESTMGYKGFFYHFLHMDTGLRHKDVELSTVDTALFLNGALTAAAYFDGPSADEAEIRKTAIALYERVDWTFMLRDNGLISMGWVPEPDQPDHVNGFIERVWDHYNEGMMVYLLAMGSPTCPIPGSSWTAWQATLLTWGTNYGQTYLGFSPMFGHQFSHIWFDFRGIADAFMRSHNSDYFTNSRHAAYAQREYAIENPSHYKAYGKDIWGLSACRGPGEFETTIDGQDFKFHEYGARGPATGDGESFDDGTLAPMAAIGSMPFAPEICLPAAHALIRRFGSDIYSPYGFYDAFNPTFPKDLDSHTGHWTQKAGWVAYEYLGIDQGPILCMLENYRSGLVWDRVCRSPVTGPIVRRGLLAAGFQPISPQGKWLVNDVATISSGRPAAGDLSPPQENVGIGRRSSAVSEKG